MVNICSERTALCHRGKIFSFERGDFVTGLERPKAILKTYGRETALRLKPPVESHIAPRREPSITEAAVSASGRM